MTKELARELIGAGVHFGHGVSRWNPKMEPYIFGKRSKIHIIDVKETLKGLLIAKKLLTDVVSSGKDVVFVGTKRQGQKAVENAAEKSGMHFVSQRWLGGMLTNFQTIRSRLKRLEELENMEATGKLQAESKKQGARLKREMRKIDTNLGGVRKMNRLPGAIVAVDSRKEHLALREASKLGIATVAIIDTDSDPDEVDVAIPANDDSIKAIEIILDELCQAIAVGKTMVKATAAAAPERKRSRRQTLASAGDSPMPASARRKRKPRSKASADRKTSDRPKAPAGEKKAAEPQAKAPVEKKKTAGPQTKAPQPPADAPAAEAKTSKTPEKPAEGAEKK